MKYFLSSIITLLGIVCFSNAYAQLMQKSEADSLAKAKIQKNGLLNFDIGEAKLTFNAYADFGYVLWVHRGQTHFMTTPPEAQ